LERIFGDEHIVRQFGQRLSWCTNDNDAVRHDRQLTDDALQESLVAERQPRLGLAHASTMSTT
jgi:hypothetical protein